MSLTVYGSPLSPFVRKVRVTLMEKGLEYTLKNVNIFPAPDWFEEISPLKRIPVLRDEEVGKEATLPDSSVICAYLERKKPDPALYPKESFAYGRALWFEEYADSEMANTIGMGTFRPMIVNRLMGKEPDTETAEKIMNEKMPRFFNYLEKEIGSRDFIVGDSLTVADIAIATQFGNLGLAGFAPDATAYPNLTRYVKSMHSRPSFEACFAEEREMLKSFGL
ncbi:MAG: glutathione S-transferase family protein [Rhizobiales bacterium]|nr:glutathione S-transferase family protein [Hyphomicrobiales bacterium]